MKDTIGNNFRHPQSNVAMLRALVGKSKFALLVAKMGGRVVRIPKKKDFAYALYLQRPQYYNSLHWRVAIDLLGCTNTHFRRLKKIHAGIENVNQV